MSFVERGRCYVVVLLLVRLVRGGEEKSGETARLKFAPPVGRRFTLTTTPILFLFQERTSQKMTVMLKFKTKVTPRRKGVKVESEPHDAKVVKEEGGH